MEHAHKIKFHFGFFLIIIASFFLNFGQDLLLSYAIIILHELAHVFAAGLLGIKLKQIELLPFGVTARFKTEEFRPRDEIIFSMAGPFLNLCLFALALYFKNNFLIIINACLFITNSLPIIPLDGGRVVRSILTIRWGVVKAYNFTKMLSKIFIAIFVIVAVAILFFNINISLLIIAGFLVVNFLHECKNDSFRLLKNGILSEVKIKKEPLRTEVITVAPNFMVNKVLKLFDKNNFYNVQVVDEGEIMDTLTETQIVEKLKSEGIRMRF